jgi:fatty acid desaturase/nitrite reductase/ring-hydroxylating ferredoxin subunit
MTRTNGRATRDTVLWLSGLVITGVLAFATLGTWWTVPAFAAYAVLYGGAADSRWHEMGHRTAFRTRWPNEFVYHLACFMLLRTPTLWRWQHARHHTDTIIVGRDPEIVTQRPPTRRKVLLSFLGLGVVRLAWRMVKQAAGQLDDNAKEFVPEEDWKKVIWQSRAHVAILVAVVAASIAIGSIVPLLFVGLPTLLGAPALVFFGLTQHAGLQEDVLDHRLNTRTVYMNPFFRFLYSNMNYHVEHHIFPTVPYHALPALHAEVKEHLAPALPSTIAAYREILPALARQAEDPTYEIEGRQVPASDSGSEPESGRGAPPTVAPESDDLVDLGPADTLGIGDIRRVDLSDHSLVVYRLSESEFALTDGVCTHGRAHLADGFLMGCVIECPKHNGRFDVRTGEPLCSPVKIPLAVYRIKVVDGRLKTDMSVPSTLGKGT